MSEFKNKRSEVQQSNLTGNDELDMALAKLARLEDQIRLVSSERDQCLREQAILQKQLTQCIDVIRASDITIKSANTYLKNQLKQISYRFKDLEQENQELNLANDAWVKYAIKLEFDLLTADEKIKALEENYELAIKNIAQLVLMLIMPSSKDV
jgi:uncharacterized protein (DUF3084 family)